MKRIFNHRVLPFICVLSLLFSFVVVPVAAASGIGSDKGTDLANVEGWSSYIGEMDPVFGDLFSKHFNFDVGHRIFFRIVDDVVGQRYGEVEYNELEVICDQLNQTFCAKPISDLYSFVDVASSIANYTLMTCFRIPNLRFEIVEGGTAGYYRIRDAVSGLFLVNYQGQYPCSPVDGVFSESEGHNQWVPIRYMNLQKYHMVSQEILYNLATVNNAGVYTYGEYLVVSQNPKASLPDQMILANADSQPYVAWNNKNQSATSQDRPTTNVTENGDIIEGDFTDNSFNLDLEGMTFNLADGTLAFIDKLVYDASTKSYHIDSHDTYNYEINNYYTWNYYINYTSVTYIGQTEEYNKYYEVYYELPDGRNSADLSKEEVEQLNVSIDVIPYGRASDDTSLRSLYHFDGDTKDLSYWNYCTEFKWNKGASLTYMDAGVFDGALYLDETEHDFSFKLPSNLASNDFTIQHRFYQSATLAPVQDSHIYIDNYTLLHMTGDVLKVGSSTVKVPVGTWNEFAMIRNGNTIYYYLNGLCWASVETTKTYGDTIRFLYGSEQQTFKYFDEFRVLDFAYVTGGASYEPTAVPHDTNLILTLPETHTVIADEYWSITSSKENLLGYAFEDYVSGSVPSWILPGTSSDQIPKFPTFTVRDNEHYSSNKNRTYGSVAAYDGFLRITKGSYGQVYTLVDIFEDDSATYGYPGSFWTLLNWYDGDKTSTYLPFGTYTFTVVTSDGEEYSLTFTSSATNDYTDHTVTFDWGSIEQCYVGTNDVRRQVLGIIPNDHVDIMYMELVEGSSTDLEVEWVESVTVIENSEITNPTLAVRTPLNITSYHIGGVRPTIPEKGEVWGMVEGDRITSLQIYTGQAWEAVDGRIWTGQRWIPYSSYNIITLQDMYDVVDATQDYEYIYSEAGFWAWWQKSWNAFTEKLFAVLGSGGGSGGSSSIVPGDVQQSASSALSSLIEGIFGVIIEVLKSLIGAAQDLLSGIFSFFSDTVFGGVKDFFSSFDELLAPFETTVENEDGTTTTTTGLPEGVAAVFSFFSGLVLVMPDELRMILMFGFGLLLLLGVFKLVKA